MTTITSNTSINQNYVDNNSWPVTIAAGLTVTFSENLVVTNANQYFIVGGSGVTIDGLGHTVEVSGVAPYTGLVRNGNFDLERGDFTASHTGGYPNATVQNIGVISSNGSCLAESNASYNYQNKSAWVCSAFFGSVDGRCTIQNCYAIGDLANGTAGILGRQSYNCDVLNCYAIVSTMPEWAGGIAGSWNQYLTVSNCYGYNIAGTEGNAGSHLIVAEADGNSGTATSYVDLSINNCYAANVSWSDTAAEDAGLQKVVDSTTVYLDLASASNVPWTLAVFNSSPPPATEINKYITTFVSNVTTFVSKTPTSIIFRN